ncbi:Uncharacterized protein TCM_029662 [Theobroma cacao]|uniref:Uncharacterized protein n=1 Tax=Theobroma cacao TaxID=3641 RepID=A0A061GLH0_THECC|nr:Uncharacterized protein TCM_029662 [Theobroma cacao]
MINHVCLGILVSSPFRFRKFFFAGKPKAKISRFAREVTVVFRAQHCLVLWDSPHIKPWNFLTTKRFLPRRNLCYKILGREYKMMATGNEC